MAEKFTTGNITILKPDNDFEMVPGAIIRNMDVFTIGVYCKLLTYGNDWKLNVKGLSINLGITMRKVQQALAAIENAGYLTRTPRRNKKGTFGGWDYVIYGNCIPEEERTVCAKIRQSVKTDIRQKPIDGEIRQSVKCADNINILESNIHTCNGNIQTKKCVSRFVAPSVYDVEAYCQEAGLTAMTAQDFCDYYESCGWKVGRNPMKDWRAAARSWNGRELKRGGARMNAPQQESAIETTLREMRDWDKNAANNPIFQQTWTPER